jgi:hypothetical protein
MERDHQREAERERDRPEESRGHREVIVAGVEHGLKG